MQLIDKGLFEPVIPLIIEMDTDEETFIMNSITFQLPFNFDFDMEVAKKFLTDIKLQPKYTFFGRELYVTGRIVDKEIFSMIKKMLLQAIYDHTCNNEVRIKM